MKECAVYFFNENVEGSTTESREIEAQSIVDAVAIVQKELIDEGKDPSFYFYTARYENELYVCSGVLK